ncbi:hypothetical protein [Microbacterium sp. T2.11-28]|uniref:hypothetical protein n=1 Tax=unclassified Microbacterium TaxID=2609290 RepID=UPI0024775C9F|nr:hypothetical protein [Microbacterium sp. T2.11-28]CAI9386180.1 hypothetical protein MICABA_00233 [Microbacterium sp. T2.11-28]
MSTSAAERRPPLPQPIVWLYVIAILVSVLAVGAGVLVALASAAFPLTTLAPLVGAAIGAYVPALLGHGIVIAVHDAALGRRR